MSVNNFEIDTENYLGLGYEQFKNASYALALSNPSEYFRIRQAVIQSVKTDAVKDIYKTFYNILTTGTDKLGSKVIVDIKGVRPQYPSQKVSEIALQASRTMDEILNEVIDIILPADYESLANHRAKQLSKASGIV